MGRIGRSCAGLGFAVVGIFCAEHPHFSRQLPHSHQALYPSRVVRVGLGRGCGGFGFGHLHCRRRSLQVLHQPEHGQYFCQYRQLVHQPVMLSAFHSWALILGGLGSGCRGSLSSLMSSFLLSL